MSNSETRVTNTYRNTISVSFAKDSKAHAELVFAFKERGRLRALGKPIAIPGGNSTFRLLDRFFDDGEFTDEVDGPVRYETHILTTEGAPCSALAADLSNDRCTEVRHAYEPIPQDGSSSPQETIDVYTGGVLTGRTVRVNWNAVHDGLHEELEWAQSVVERCGVPEPFRPLLSP